ncbi:MAG: helix-turn-helix domain-containing protein [Acutalibacteraceae bacterium]
MTIGEFIRKRRTELNMTLEEVGKYVGVQKSTVRKWEVGDISNMKRDKIDALAKILKVSPAIFTNDTIEDYDKAIEQSNSNEQPTFDSDIRRIERARKKMTEQEKDKMMKILEASFE